MYYLHDHSVMYDHQHVRESPHAFQWHQTKRDGTALFGHKPVNTLIVGRVTMSWCLLDIIWVREGAG